jgi:uncharacterized protein (DUF433 family)
MDTSSTPTWKYLAPNPKSSYQQLYVKGTRITARTLYGWYAGPESFPPEEIAAQFNLPVEAVLESIAYCESNPPELLADYAREQALIDAASKKPDGRLSPQEKAEIRRQYRIQRS